LLDILTIALCAVLCGANDFTGMVAFAALHLEAFQTCFLGWVGTVASGTAGQVVPINYLLSAPLSAQAFAAAVHSHRGIENQAHWILDVAFHEAASRARAGYAARNLAVVHHLVLNLLRQDITRKGGIATKCFAAALDDAYLTTIRASLAP